MFEPPITFKVDARNVGDFVDLKSFLGNFPRTSYKLVKSTPSWWASTQFVQFWNEEDAVIAKLALPFLKALTEEEYRHHSINRYHF